MKLDNFNQGMRVSDWKNIERRKITVDVKRVNALAQVATVDVKSLGAARLVQLAKVATVRRGGFNAAKWGG